jgi:hypothetical protein
VIRQRAAMTARTATREVEKAKKARAAAHKKGKNTRQSYTQKDMDNVTNAGIRQGDWYVLEQNFELEKPYFWCAEQMFIFKDVYEKLRRPIRPMHPLGVEYMSAKDYLNDALWIYGELNLTKLYLYLFVFIIKFYIMLFVFIIL